MCPQCKRFREIDPIPVNQPRTLALTQLGLILSCDHLTTSQGCALITPDGDIFTDDDLFKEACA